jgi:arylsulfatase A-like enzyme
MKKLFVILFLFIGTVSLAQQKVKAPKSTKPNILLICTDDVGIWNVGAYSHGMMVPTPNIDRLAKEGMLFTDHYAAPTCTPGRAMLVTGQLPIRTGLDHSRNGRFT